MKQIGAWCLILLGILIGIPTLVVYGGGHYNDKLLQNVKALKGQGETRDLEQEQEDELILALAKVVDPTAPEEAIKTYAVMLRTYKLRRQLGIVSKGTLASMTQEEMKLEWGKNYKAYYNKLEQAVKDTAGEVIYYENELIEPIYHKESAGWTRSAKTIYKQDIPYLQPVESKYDTVEETFTFTEETFIQLLQEAYAHLALQPEQLSQQIQIVAKDQVGYIESLQIGNLLIDGESLRKILDLSSACFTVTQTKDSISFNVKGIGHGIGLSQNGANEMAKLGATYKEILAYYYTGTKVQVNS